MKNKRWGICVKEISNEKLEIMIEEEWFDNNDTIKRIKAEIRYRKLKQLEYVE